MSAAQPARLYSTVQLRENPRKDDILALYGRIDPATFLDVQGCPALADLMSVLTGREDFEFIESLRFSLPAAVWTDRITLPRDISERHFDGKIDSLSVELADLTELVIAYKSTKPDQLTAFADALCGGAQGDFVTVDCDLPFRGTYHWCPTGRANRLFGNRQMAERLVGVDSLHAEGLRGDGVIAVVIDQGVNESLFPENFVLRWPSGESPVRGPEMDHGDMIAHNIVASAPRAGIIDLPVLPPRISDQPSFLSDVQAAYNAMLALIRAVEPVVPSLSWVFVNAWAVYDRRLENGMAVKYSDDPRHAFNRKMQEIAAEFSGAPVDVMTAAGNCGEFCSDSRCGPGDTGPGNSILGASAHPDVLTVGAVRTDNIWIGSSSQGPGLIAQQKPDICAPSHFGENAEAHNDNLGTSAAAAMAAGVVALLRSGNNPKGAPTPAALRELLRSTARKTGAPAGWDGRQGFGTIDAKAAYDAM